MAMEQNGLKVVAWAILVEHVDSSFLQDDHVNFFWRRRLGFDSNPVPFR